MNNKSNNGRQSKIRILLVCSYKIIQESLKALIEDSQDIEVVGSICTSGQLPKATNFADVDAVLIYLVDKDTETVEIIAELLKTAPSLRVIILTGSKDIKNQTRAIQLGAVGIVQKEQNARMLIEAIRQVYRGETWINQKILAKLLGNSNDKKEGLRTWNSRKTDSLTRREKEVIQMIGKGLKNKNIAEKLFISEATVRHHLSSIYEKLDVEDRLNLVIYAYQQGIVEFHNPVDNEQLKL